MRQDHPRLRGEHPHFYKANFTRVGSPPPTRGTHGAGRFNALTARITPAYAGNTGSLNKSIATVQDHPRLRGEHSSTVPPVGIAIGSPPPTRGTLCVNVKFIKYNRITPAYAGNTCFCRYNAASTQDHPRLRGEHSLPVAPLIACTGSPPPTRGTQINNYVQLAHIRITPAYAGNTLYQLPR